MLHVHFYDLDTKCQVYEKHCVQNVVHPLNRMPLLINTTLTL